MKVPLSPDREGALLEWNVGGTQGSDPRSTRELSPRGFKHTRQKRDGAGDGARNARSQVAPDLKQSQRNRRASDDPQDAQRDSQTRTTTQWVKLNCRQLACLSQYPLEVPHDSALWRITSRYQYALCLRIRVCVR
jgi:hypothetical protein